MTNEEILNEAKDYANSMSLCYPMERDDYEKAFLEGAKKMDEYAKQQAIAFAKWTAINLWIVHGENWYPYLDEDNPISESALYDQFIEQQTENK